jgi:AhpD family alkylhydroperoxidase
LENQVELNEERIRVLDKFKEAYPGINHAMDGVRTEVYKDGALTLKVKRLISLAIALRAGCVNCILAQTMHALNEGASTEEILETIAVELSMSGTTGVAESLRVIKLLEELGKL